MRNNKPFTMIAPSAGFTPRVMARIAERERAQVQRRALIGSALLAASAFASLALLGILFAAWLALTVFDWIAFTSSVVELASVADFARVLFNALWLAVLTIATSTDSGIALMYAFAVLALTMLWTRIVFFQRPLTQTAWED